MLPLHEPNEMSVDHNSTVECRRAWDMLHLIKIEAEVLGKPSHYASHNNSPPWLLVLPTEVMHKKSSQVRLGV